MPTHLSFWAKVRRCCYHGKLYEAATATSGSEDEDEVAPLQRAFSIGWYVLDHGHLESLNGRGALAPLEARILFSLAFLTQSWWAVSPGCFLRDAF